MFYSNGSIIWISVINALWFQCRINLCPICEIFYTVEQDSANNSTLPRYSKKLADLETIHVGTYENGPLVIRLGLESNTVGIQLSDMSGNWMAISSPVTEWFVIQVTIQLPD